MICRCGAEIQTGVIYVNQGEVYCCPHCVWSPFGCKCSEGKPFEYKTREDVLLNYYEDDEPDDLWWDDRELCSYCGGDGWGIVGCDWDSDDYINGPFHGEIQQCPCCNGSGKAEDMTFC
jgi:hypothetical protein